MERIQSSLYDRLSLEVLTFLPDITIDALKSATMDELLELTAKARLVEEMLSDVVGHGIIKAFAQLQSGPKK